MKRSIIILSVLVVFIAAGVISEIVYAKLLTDKLKESIEVCKKTDDFNELSQVSSELEEYLTSKEKINRIFFTRKFIERLQTEVSNMEVYAKARDGVSFKASLKRLQLHVEDTVY